MAAPYITMDDLTSTTHRFIEPRFTDVIYQSDALLYVLIKQLMKDFEGGFNITAPILTGQLRGASSAPGAPFDLSVVETNQALTFIPKYYWVNISIPGYTLALNRGNLAMVLDLVTTKLFAGTLQFASLLSNDLYKDGQGTNSTTLALDGLLAAIDNGTNFPTYGLLTRSAIASGANKGLNAYYLNVAGPLTFGIVQTAFASSTVPPAHPTLFISNTDVWTIVWTHMQVFEVQMKPDVGGLEDTGARVMQFNGQPFAISNYAPTQTLWGIHHPTLEFYVSSAPRYRFGFSGWNAIPGADIVAGQIQFIGNLVDTGSRFEFQLTGITS